MYGEDGISHFHVPGRGLLSMGSTHPQKAPDKKGSGDRPTGARAMAQILRTVLEAVSGVTPEIRARFNDESLCLRCGRCCYSAIKVKDRMVMLKDLPCRFLTYDPEGKAACRVYETRELTGWCNRINVASIRKELFPPDCPYMKDVPNYKGKVEIDDREFERIKPILKNVFKLVDKPEYVRHSDWKNFLGSIKE